MRRNLVDWWVVTYDYAIWIHGDSMLESFYWRGEPIGDIAAWANERGERLIEYNAVRFIPDICTGHLVEERRSGRMPESFWNELRLPDGWVYTEVNR